MDNLLIIDAETGDASTRAFTDDERAQREADAAAAAEAAQAAQTAADARAAALAKLTALGLTPDDLAALGITNG